MSRGARSGSVRWAVVGVFAMVGLAAAGAWTRSAPVTYRATSTAFVAARSSSTVPELQQGQDLVLKQASSHADVATTPIVLDPVIRELGLHADVPGLAARVSASTPSGTALLTIGVDDTDPVRAAAVANAISTRLVAVSTDLRPAAGGSPARLVVVQPARRPAAPVGPDRAQRLVLGLGGGAGIGAALAFLPALLRRRPPGGGLAAPSMV